MVSKVEVNRRRFGMGLAATAALPLSGGFTARAIAGAGTDAAAPEAAGDIWSKLDALTADADKLGLSAPRMSLGPATATDALSDVGPAILDLMREVERSIPEVRSLAPGEGDALLERASDLLIEATQAERSPREMEEGEEDEETRAMRAAPYPTMPPLSEIAGEYRELFASCKVRSEHQSTIDDYVSRMLDKSARDRYNAIYVETCIPWYFVAGIHALEATFNFNTHLHNGDSLRGKTTHVPSGRPKVWNPPNDWATSAVDALTMKAYEKETSWTLPEVLYRWEKYNGVRSRVLHKINTPYLWSYSQHYTKGKYKADNVWDPNYVSKQPGAAVLLRRLVDMGKVRVKDA